MLGHGKMCLFASFMLGAAAGYMYHEYYSPAKSHKKKGNFDPVIVVPKCWAKKARKLKKDLEETWEDLM